MTRRIDDIFSLESLRKKWEPEADEKETPEPAPRKENSPWTEIWESLETILARRFPEEQMEGPAVLLTELEALLEKRFSPDPVPEAEMEALNEAVSRVLDDLEDLTEAMSMEDPTA